MQRHKSQRHVQAANTRWRRADAERAEGISDAPMLDDARQPFGMQMSAFGWRDVVIEPRFGYVGWRVIDASTGEVLHCAASKELLRWIAGQIPRMLAARNFQ